MNVTKTNFREACKAFDTALEKCDFIAIDCEFTGVSTEDNKILPYDSPDQAYRKYLENTSGFIVIQFGVTLLNAPAPATDTETFSYQSYNFYVCPRSWRTNFLCQGSCMSFLAENGFDFTKLFRDGIPYSNEQEEKILRERLRDRQKLREEARNNSGDLSLSFNHIPVPDEEKEAMDSIENEIQAFIDSEDDEKVIGGCNGFQRKLIYELIEAKFGDKVTATTKNVDTGKAIVIHRRKSKEEEDKIEKDLQENELNDLEDNIGVSLIIKKISDSRKPIIGHNLLLDILFILRQFIRPLPDSLVEFKKYAHKMFPVIIDTKYMCTLPEVKSLVISSKLGDIIDTFCQTPHSLPKLESINPHYSYSLEEKKEHEAGYDSYLTAVAFLGIIKLVHGTFCVPPKDIYNAQEYVNRLFLLKLPDIGFLNLVGFEQIPARDHVFHVTIPEEWKQSNLVHHFRNYGPIHVTWINQNSALISLHKKENSSSVLKTIGSVSGFKVQSFNDFKESLQYRINGNDSSSTAKSRKRKLSDDKTTMDEGAHSDKKMKPSSTQDESKPQSTPQNTVKTKATTQKVKGFNESDDW